MTLAVKSQSPEEAFYIFRNDGQFNALFYSEVDRVIFPYFDKKSNNPEDSVFRVVYNADSVMFIPMAVVDSITFSPDALAPNSNMGWSDLNTIRIPVQPSCAIVNIMGVGSMPEWRNQEFHAWMEVWDRLGNYFQKRVILSAQGNSSQLLIKKNFSATFCEDEWKGDKTTKITIGDWVEQDCFHFKAYHTSITKGECPVSYKLYDKMLETKPKNRRAPYMAYDKDSDVEDDEGSNPMAGKARCYPDGFPCIVYLNGQYYGIFSWQLRKHRDNYRMNRNSIDHIHLDGDLGEPEIWGGTLKWTSFEVRNPKPKASKWELLCQDGTVYDGNNPKELMDEDSEYYDAAEVNCVMTAQTKARIISLSHYMDEISVYEEAFKNATVKDRRNSLKILKEEIEKRFSVEWMIDYLILACAVQNSDAVRKNWQWTTWGKINGYMKWFPNPYDIDHAFGVLATNAFRLGTPSLTTIGKDTNTPARYIWDYYLSDMKARYADLRDAGVISYETIWGLMEDWVSRIGEEHYRQEQERWPDMPCYRDSYLNPRWTQTLVSKVIYDKSESQWVSTSQYSKDRYEVGDLVPHNRRLYKSLKVNLNHEHEPGAPGSEEWWEDLCVKEGIYKSGQTVYDGYGSFYQFIVPTGRTVVVKKEPKFSKRPDGLVNTPFDKFYSDYPYEGGVYDSVNRIRDWIKEKIQLLDEQMSYSEKI